jgi:DNA-directed RNA polymerase specialized sigma24 family protein
MHGLAASRTRRGRRLRLLHDALGDPETAIAAGSSGPAEELETREFLADLVARTPDERLRRIILLRAEGLTMAEVAVRVGLSRQRVEQLLQRARLLVTAQLS